MPAFRHDAATDYKLADTEKASVAKKRQRAFWVPALKSSEDTAAHDTYELPGLHYS
ncbi:hypothetical protein N9L68_00460 [bacterium]|nr:hypothetical protein [bacterium]